jgi:2-polyprenyl-3-methyl-5-hydroxy-6-metoxy-1,4-benzoquinol methylase
LSKTKNTVHERESSYYDNKFDNFKFTSSLGIRNLGYETYCEASRWKDALLLLGDLGKKYLVDVGCGSGKNSLILAKLGAKVTGIDISEKSVQTAMKWAALQGIQADFFVGAAEELDKILCLRSADIVIFHAVLHHIPDLNSAIHSAFKILKPGGILLAFEPKDENPIAVIGRRSAVKQSFDEHPFKFGELEPIMEKHFGNVNSKYYCLMSPLYLGFDFHGLKALGRICFGAFDLIDKALLSVDQFKRWTWLQLLWCTKGGVE